MRTLLSRRAPERLNGIGTTLRIVPAMVVLVSGCADPEVRRLESEIAAIRSEIDRHKMNMEMAGKAIDEINERVLHSINERSAGRKDPRTPEESYVDTIKLESEKRRYEEARDKYDRLRDDLKFKQAQLRALQ